MSKLAHIWPVLFRVYIIDIADLVANRNVYVKLYADDIKMYLFISDSDQQTLHLQNSRLVQKQADRREDRLFDQFRDCMEKTRSDLNDAVKFPIGPKLGN